MKGRYLYAALAALLTAAGWARVREAGSAAHYTFRHENVLGTSLEVRIAASSSAAAARAEQATLLEIDRLSGILSAWNPASEFSRWQAAPKGQSVRVSPELREALTLFDHWCNQTGGALNASAETIGRVWKAAAAQRRVPTAVELKEAVRLAGQRHWSLGEGTATRLSDAPVALNSLAKSYIAGKAARAALETAGAAGVLVNIGGDLVARGDFAAPVDIADPLRGADNGAPLATIGPVRDFAVASSGSARRGYDIGGRHYSHIVDPRTGLTADAVAGVTVTARDSATAGALATAFSVMGPAASLRLAAAHPGVEFLMIAANGARTASPGWSRMLALAPAPQAVTAAAAASLELSIQFTLARIADSRYRRPYVAVWIEDKDKVPVRTLALWVEKLRWLPDLRAWHRGDRLRSLAEGNEIVNSVSSATRPPGKYSLSWDLKDAAGKPVKPGKYTVCIEAAREHGTYQMIRHEMEFSGAPRQATLPGNIEIESASLDYRKPASGN